MSERPLALVTGGRHRLGGAIAAALATAGYDLAIHCTHDCELDEALGAAIAATGTTWTIATADFTNPASAGELFGKVTGHFGRAPDLLVNSAAMFGQDRLADVTADDLARHYAVNAATPALLTQAFAAAPTTSEPGERSIVNLLDQRIDQPNGDQLAYTLSKIALAGLTRITARDLAPAIRVNAVAPGLTIVTDDYDETLVGRLTTEMPLHRLPAPEDVAAAILYLAGARAVTGQVVYVDAGARLKSFDRDFMHL